MTILDSKKTKFFHYQFERINHWDEVACQLDHWRGWGGYYHKRLEQIYKFLIIPKQRVLEIGCAFGDLLAAVDPEFGVGLDFSSEMLNRGKRRHPEITFIQADAHNLPLDQEFDYIILSDLLNDLWDVQLLFEQIKKLSFESFTTFQRIEKPYRRKEVVTEPCFRFVQPRYITFCNTLKCCRHVHECHLGI